MILNMKGTSKQSNYSNAVRSSKLRKVEKEMLWCGQRPYASFCVPRETSTLFPFWTTSFCFVPFYFFCPFNNMIGLNNIEFKHTNVQYSE